MAEAIYLPNNRRALQLWKLGWQRSPESSLDPQNPNGPIPFTSTCFLALAHVRLVLDIGPHRDLHTRDPLRISAALQELPRVERSRMVIPALLHSAHALSIPIKLGIDFVAKSQHFFWGIYHSVCSFECAVFLSRWLYQVESEGIKGNDVVGGKFLCTRLNELNIDENQNMKNEFCNG